MDEQGPFRAHNLMHANGNDLSNLNSWTSPTLCPKILYRYDDDSQ